MILVLVPLVTFWVAVAANGEDSLRELRKKAENGNAPAQLALGRIYDDENGVPEDKFEAARWYRMAAEQGNVAGQYYLGLMYRDGEGVPQDFTAAMKWFRLAADQGSADAQYNLGLMLFYGKGVFANQSDGVKWLRRAAEQGNADAKAQLAPLTLVIQAMPTNVSFSVFLGYEFVYTGVTPFQAFNIPSGKYNICFEERGYELYWRTLTVGAHTPPVNVSLRASNSQNYSLGCRQSNEKLKSERIAELQSELIRLNTLMNTRTTTTVVRKRGTGQYISQRRRSGNRNRRAWRHSEDKAVVVPGQ